MSELLAPIAVAILFVVFGLLRRGRAETGCGAGCASQGECSRGGDCPNK